jgi:hypothetical protein
MRTTTMLALCALATLSAIGCATRPGPRITTERPAIIVRGGSVIFQLTDKHWKRSGRDWKPDHPDAPAVNVYVVTLEDDTGRPLCGPYAGDTVKLLTSGGALAFALDRDGGFLGLGKKEPRLKPSSTLTPDTAMPEKLTATDQTFLGMRVVLSSGTCEVSGSVSLVRIRPQA